MQTHDLGPIFVHKIRLKRRSSLIHRADTHEIEPPYRHSRSWVFRIWGELGFVLGFWRKGTLSEEESLMTALAGHESRLLDSDGHILDEYEIGQEAPCEPR